MGILGLTHDENGAAMERLPVTIKVAIGEGPLRGEPDSHPRRLDHFVFKRKTLREQDVVWEPAPEIIKIYGEKPTELGILFLHDDPGEVLRTEYAFWTPGGCRCRGKLLQIANGDGVKYEMRAVRRTRKHPEGEPWPGSYRYSDGPKKGQPVEPCGESCPDLERGDCKPSGDLYFILERFPTLGAVCRLHTSSYRSIRNLSNGLMQIRRFHGGHLAGIKAVLKAIPERIWYSDRDGTRHSSVAYILSLEMSGEHIPGFDASPNEPVMDVEQSSTASGAGQPGQYSVCETDAERAQEIAGEFYPDGGIDKPDEAESPQGLSGDGEQLARIRDLARKLGYNQAQTSMKLGQWAGRLADLEAELLNELGSLAEASGPSREEAASNQMRKGTKRETEGPGAPVPTSSIPRLPDGEASGEGFLF